VPLDGEVRSLAELFQQLVERPPLSEEEFRFRIEPFREQRHLSVPFLVERLRQASQVEIPAAILHETASEVDVPLLLAAFRDPAFPERARLEVAQVLAGIGSDRLASWLDPEELARLSALSLDVLLGRYDSRPGVLQVVELYRRSSADDRRALIDAIEMATRSPASKIRLATALDPLFGAEPEPALRRCMIERLAGRPEPASARTLARWAGLARGPERRRIREALRRLAAAGVRPPARPDLAEAWVSGADGTGSFSVGLAFPTALGLRDVVLACIGVDTGLRAVTLLAAVEREAVREIRESLEEIQEIPVVPVDSSVALGLVRSARQRSVELGRPLPAGYAAAAPYLERPVPVPPPAEDPPRPPELPRGATETLLEHPAYGSWMLFREEIPPWAAAAAGEVLASSNEVGEQPSALRRRLDSIAVRALRALEGGPVAERLARMLQHQAWIHRQRGETTLAWRALAAVAEVEAGPLAKSPFAVRLLERSLQLLYERPTAPRRPEVRETFKRAIERSGPIRRRDVLVLDLAEAMFRHLEDRNEALSPLERLTLEELEAASLGAAGLATDEFCRETAAQPPLPGFEPPLVPRSAIRRRLRRQALRSRLEARLSDLLSSFASLPPERRESFAASLAGVARWFAEDVCLGPCHEQCLADPNRDGRHLFYSARHPAGPETAAILGHRAVASGSTWARRQLARQVEAAARKLEGVLAAVSALGSLPAAQTPLRARIVAGLRRLERLRVELDRLPSDPEAVYSRIEEVHSLRLELDPLLRALAIACLARQRAGTRRPTGPTHAVSRFDAFLRRHGVTEISAREVEAALSRTGDWRQVLPLLVAACEASTPASVRRLSERLAELAACCPRGVEPVSPEETASEVEEARERAGECRTFGFDARRLSR
jgi:hypothetical protein